MQRLDKLDNVSTRTVMSKTLCKSKRTKKIDKRTWNRTVEGATHICRKCGRLADAKKRLCKALKLSRFCGSIPVIWAAVLLAIGVGVIAPVAHADDSWASFQNGGTPAMGSSRTLPLKWSDQDADRAWAVALPGYGQSSPVIWRKTIYVTSVSGKSKDKLHVRAIDLASGKTRWEKQFKNASPERLTNYVSKAAPTPAADAAGVIAFFEGGNLVALTHDGQSRWERNLVDDYGPITARHGLAASLEQDEQRVFVWVERSRSPYVLAVDKTNGKTLWKADGLGTTSWTSPRLVPVQGEERHLVLSGGGRLAGLDPATGKQLWDFREVSNNNVQTPLPLGGGRVLFGASEGRGEASRPGKFSGVLQIKKQASGYEIAYVWKADKATSSFGSPIVAGNNAYFVNRTGVLFCLDAKSGRQRYARRIDSSVWATPLHAGERIYLFGRNGMTTVVRTGDAFEVLAENRLWAKPAAAPRPAAGGRPAFGGPVLYAVAATPQRLVLRSGNQLFCMHGVAPDATGCSSSDARRPAD